MLTAVGVIFALAGLALVVSIRFDRTVGVAQLAGIGRLSRTTLMMSGLALLGVGYHLLNAELNLGLLAAPVPVACAVALAVVVLSLVADAIMARDHTVSDDTEADR